MNKTVAEYVQLIQRHQNAAYGYIPETNDLLAYPYHKIVKFYFNALAYFGMHDHYESFEQITEPREGVDYWIREADTRRIYKWKDGQFIERFDCPDSVLE